MNNPLNLEVNFDGEELVNVLVYVYVFACDFHLLERIQGLSSEHSVAELVVFAALT